MISHFEIFEYWKDKGITKAGEIVDRASDEVKYEMIIVPDWGEPSCWGCGVPIISDYEKTANRSDVDLKLLWNHKEVKSKLNRCHIIPKALGGSDSPDNLFLMCESCHAESPDTINKSAFIRWVYEKRSKYTMGISKIDTVVSWINNDLKNRGFPDIRNILNMLPYDYRESSLFSIDDFKSFSKDRIGSHEFGIVPNSLIITLVDFILDEFINAHLCNI